MAYGLLTGSQLFGTDPESYFLDMMEVMEKQRSRKNRKSTKQPVDKEKGPYAVREAGTGRYLLPSNTRLKDVLVHQKKGRDYIIVANPPRMDDGVTDEVLIETISRQAPSHHEYTLPDRAIDPVIDRATEVIGDRQEAMRWLGTPVRGLDFATPISLLATEEGQMRVNDILGQMEHGIW